MHIGVPKETIINETRVAITPKTVGELIKLGFSVSIETEAGIKANFNNEEYEKAGATIKNRNDIWLSDIILKVNAPEKNEVFLLHPKTILISFIWPEENSDLIKKLAKRNITVISMDSVPRISRAQSLDALSSMANIIGYRSIIEAAYEFERLFVGQITSAGKISPAKVMVIGAGVAGLSAIRTARSLGAIVCAFDTRPEVKEQVKSIGAEFLELNYNEEIEDKNNYTTLTSKEFLIAEKKFFDYQAKKVDIIITTVLIPGKPSPKLISYETVRSMKSGSIIVDLAAKNGGNCECTVKNEIIKTENNVKIIGYTNLLYRYPTQSSQLYSSNLVNLLKLLCKNKDGVIIVDFNDIIIRSMTIIYDGKITWSVPKIQTSVKTSLNFIKKEKKAIKVQQHIFSPWKRNIIYILTTIFLFWLSMIAPNKILDHFTIFFLSCIVGYYVVWNVTYSLHTPLMSVTNAISGIIIIGAISQISHGGLISYLSFIAILVSSINIFGGFIITRRILKMFHKD